MTKEQIKDYTLRITGSSPTEIIVILFELAVTYIDDAKKAYEKGDRLEFRAQCTNAQKVVGDLMGSLDFTYPLAMPLYRIYEFISGELSRAIIKNDPDILQKSRDYLVSLKDSFEKVASQDDSGPAMTNAQSVYAGLTYGKGTLNESVDTRMPNRGFKA